MTNMRTTRRWMVGLISGLGLSLAALADPGLWSSNGDDVVLDGYDVVAYHRQDRAVRGTARFSTEYEGAKLHFSNQEHLAAFREEPTKYAPKFGGFCAFGVAMHKAKVPANPETFKIYNGELLLFFDDLYEGQPVNTKILWNQNESSLYGQAVSTWKTLD